MAVLGAPINFSAVKKKFPTAFRPSAPPSWKTKPNTWLSNVDIDATLFQYEQVDDSFAFMGTFPLDFSTAKARGGTCMFNNMCSFAVAQLPPNKSKFAVVVNTDPHSKGGKHWIALFCRRDQGIYFFDSYGKAPPVAVKNFMKQVSSELKQRNPRFEAMHNTRRIQTKNTECGVFCTMFVVRMMDDDMSFKDVCDAMEDDADIQRFRQVMWNSPDV
jgi:hypothetical protein